MIQLALLFLLVTPDAASSGLDPRLASSSRTVPTAEKLVYPTFEPFLASRMFKVFFEDVEKLDLEEALTTLEAIGGAQEAAKRSAGDARTKPEQEGPRALLEPEIDAKVRGVYMVLPVAMMKLEPLWRSKTWTADQIATATSAAKIFAKVPGSPKLEFVAGKDAANRSALEGLVRWFHGETAKPECYAAMIPTMDDGPYQGLDHEAKEPLAASATRVLGDKQKTEIRLCKIARPKEPWVLQGVRGGKVLWSRIWSGAPDESVTDVEFTGEPKPVGTYGWIVPMAVQWTYGKEQAYLYVDAKGGFLFYFMSW